MKYVAAYLLSNLAGNDHPTVQDIEKILKSVGAGFDNSRAQELVNQLSDRKLEEVIAEGSAKFASVPTGVSMPSVAAHSEVPAAKAEEPKATKPQQQEPEDMGFSIFD
jgi:large subunit ribosomal protein LP2